MRWRKTLLAASAAAIVVAGISGASAHGDDENHDDSRRGSAEDSALAAMQRDVGLTRQQAEELAKRQAAAVELDRTLQRKLGTAYAGALFDAEDGSLTVMATTKQAAQAARSAGAEAKVVARGLAELEKVQHAIDAANGVERATGREREEAPRSDNEKSVLQSWHVDVASNTVLVEAKPGLAGRASKAVARYGDAVSVVESEVPVGLNDSWWDGGDDFNGCSVGFNVRNHSTGTKYTITAGHCVDKWDSIYGHNGDYYGYTLESWFDAGIDDALLRASSYNSWIEGPWVDYNPSHGNVISINGYGRAPVGAVVCKSGKTTKWTCGKILAHNVTVNYVSGDTVYGLNKSDNCTQPGDSGGPWVRYYSGWKADGVTSGGSIASCSWSGFRSYYAPVKTALDYYGPKYGISMY